MRYAGSARERARPMQKSPTASGLESSGRNAEGRWKPCASRTAGPGCQALSSEPVRSQIIVMIHPDRPGMHRTDRETRTRLQLNNRRLIRRSCSATASELRRGNSAEPCPPVTARSAMELPVPLPTSPGYDLTEHGESSQFRLSSPASRLSQSQLRLNDSRLVAESQ